jgi:hypothetical protein
VLWCRRMFVSIRVAEHKELPRDFSFLFYLFPSLSLVSSFLRPFHSLRSCATNILNVKVSKFPTCTCSGDFPSYVAFGETILRLVH